MSDTGPITTQEITAAQEAEKAAMEKVTDIYNTPLYKHAFNRNPVDYGLEEGGLMPPKNSINISVDRLKGIIKMGLLSDQSADNTGHQISKNYSDPNNENHVSLSSPLVKVDESFVSAFPPYHAYIEALKQQQIPKEPAPEDIFVILVKPDIIPPNPLDRKMGISADEVLKEDRVSQEAFKGIVILDQRLNNGKTGTKFADDDLHPEAVAAEIAQLQQATYGSDVRKYFPVYGNSGALYWPKRMSYEEVQEYHAKQTGQQE